MFVPDWKRARELTVHPGAYCTVDRRHLTVVFEETPVERSSPQGFLNEAWQGLRGWLEE